MHSFITPALLTAALVTQASAIAIADQELTPEDNRAFLGFVKGFLSSKHLHARQEPDPGVTDTECVYDEYDSFLSSYSSATPFCSNFISVPLATSTSYFTPTV